MSIGMVIMVAVTMIMIKITIITQDNNYDTSTLAKVM